MRILFDHGTPSGLARSLTGHSVTEAIERVGREFQTANCWPKLKGRALSYSYDRQKYPLPAEPEGPENSHHCAWQFSVAHGATARRPHCSRREGRYTRQLCRGGNPVQIARRCGNKRAVPPLHLHSPHGSLRSSDSDGGDFRGHGKTPADTRLGGHALENSLFREFNETYRLSAGNRWEILQEFLDRRSAFPVVDQCLDGTSAAHPRRIDQTTSSSATFCSGVML